MVLLGRAYCGEDLFHSQNSLHTWSSHGKLSKMVRFLGSTLAYREGGVQRRHDPRKNDLFWTISSCWEFFKKRFLVEIKAKYFLLETTMRGYETEWREAWWRHWGWETSFAGPGGNSANLEARRSFLDHGASYSIG